MCLPRGPVTWCPSAGLCFSDCGAVARLPGRAGEGMPSAHLAGAGDWGLVNYLVLPKVVS